jgi:hypothetical protein
MVKYSDLGLFATFRPSRLGRGSLGEPELPFTAAFGVSRIVRGHLFTLSRNVRKR